CDRAACCERLEPEAAERLRLAIQVREGAHQEFATSDNGRTGHSQAALFRSCASQSSGGVPLSSSRLSNRRTVLSRPERIVSSSSSPVRLSRATTLSLPCLIR